MPSPFAQTPKPPYYAVIFTSVLGERDLDNYAAELTKILEIAVEQPGYLGIESTRGADGTGITIVYYDSLDAIDNWRRNADHARVKAGGRKTWYDAYKLRIARVESECEEFVRKE